jgi:hypothetical protein
MKRMKGSLSATIDSVDEVRQELARWSGSEATLWSYRVTHSALAIRLTREGVAGNLHVECFGVLRFSGPVRGRVSFVIEDTTLHRGLPGFHLQDVGETGISVHCDDIVLTKNVTPVS